VPLLVLDRSKEGSDNHPIPASYRGTFLTSTSSLQRVSPTSVSNGDPPTHTLLPLP
jgi:hypothetical protein